MKKIIILTLAVLMLISTTLASAAIYNLWSSATGDEDYGQSIGNDLNGTSAAAYSIGMKIDTAGSLTSIGKVVVALKRLNPASGSTIRALVYADSGSYPTGSALGYADVSDNNLTTNFTDVTFIFPTPIAVSPSTYYHILIASDDLNSSIRAAINSTGGSMYFHDGLNDWQGQSKSLRHEIYSAANDQPPFINSFATSNNTILNGSSTVLTFSATNATELDLSGVNVTGETDWSVSPNINTTYTLTAFNSFGNDTQNLNIIVYYPRIACTVANYTNGSGSQLDPLQVGNVLDLDCIRVNLSANYILTNDFDVSSAGNWISIGKNLSGDCVEAFSGTFSGNNKIISGLTLNSSKNDGLFCQVSNAVFSNLTLLNAYDNIPDNSPPSQSYGFSGFVSGLSSNSNFSNIRLVNATWAGLNTGQLLGYYGGLAGDMSGGVVDNCSITYQSSGSRRSFFGGLVGRLRDGGILSHSYANGTTSGSSDSPNFNGVLVGRLQSGSQVLNSWATGNIDAGSGCLVGHLDGSIMNNSYSTCFVAGATGAFTSGTANNVYYLNSGGQDSADGIGVPSINLTKQATFINWDFNNIWRINEGIGYPYLNAPIVCLAYADCINNVRVCTNRFPLNFAGNLDLICISPIQQNNSDVVFVSNSTDPQNVTDLVIEEAVVSNPITVDFSGESIDISSLPANIIVVSSTGTIQSVSINTLLAPELDKPARITMHGISEGYHIYRDGTECTGLFGACTVVSYSGGTLVFDVTGFSTYTVGAYTTEDLSTIIVDGIGTVFAAIVDWIELIVLALVLVVLGGVVIKIAGMFK